MSQLRTRRRGCVIDSPSQGSVRYCALASEDPVEAQHSEYTGVRELALAETNEPGPGDLGFLGNLTNLHSSRGCVL